MAVSIDLWREGICDLARYACGGEKGRGKLDPVYVEVTEGRDVKPYWNRYSSCADLAHFIAQRVGVREAWVNRTSDDVFGPWVSGVNVSRLMSVAKPPGEEMPEPGDVLVLFNAPAGTDAHVCVYLGPNPHVPGDYLTANYGAGGMSPSEFPGAKIGSRPLTITGGVMRYGAKRVQRILRVPELVARRTAAPDFSGPAECVMRTGEVLDALEVES